MSDETDAITAALGRASHGVAEAQQRIAAAGSKAEGVAARAGGQLGMHAVARQLHALREANAAQDAINALIAAGGQLGE